MQYFTLFMARRYLMSPKKRSIINIISGISAVGVTIGTMALIVILSVFNGLENLIASLMNSFDPDLKITLAEGKSFAPDSSQAEQIRQLEGVISLTEVLEETALLEYSDKQYIGQIKGVSDDFLLANAIDSFMWDGEFNLYHDNEPHAVVGYGVAYNLSIGLKFINPLFIYVPSRSSTAIMNPESAFNRQMLFPSGIFSIQNEYDSKYVFVPLSFAQDLLEQPGKATALEVRFSQEISKSRQNRLHRQVQDIMGPKYQVQNRRQQHEMINRIMQSEKWMIFLILSFVLFIASFNIISSLTMLIIDKKDDILTLRSLGANRAMIRNIFLLEGWLVSVVGALAGLFLGGLISWLQIRFELIQFPTSTIVDAYPVAMKSQDFFMVFGIVALIGLFAAWYPVRFITRRFLQTHG